MGKSGRGKNDKKHNHEHAEGRKEKFYSSAAGIHCSQGFNKQESDELQTVLQKLSREERGLSRLSFIKELRKTAAEAAQRQF